LTCFWPANPSILATSPYTPDVPLDFQGEISQGSEAITYTWDFGDGETGTGQVIQHTYTANGTYTAVMTVTGEACPIARSLVATKTIVIGTGVPDKLTYLPLILKLGGGTTGTEAPPLVLYKPRLIAGAPGQVTGLAGESTAGGPIQLAWQPNPASDEVSGYRVYRSPQGALAFGRLADLPATALTYTDTSATCGMIYFVTAYNQTGESLPSTASYFTLPCR
jgi:PKD repeat protein